MQTKVVVETKLERLSVNRLVKAVLIDYCNYVKSSRYNLRISTNPFKSLLCTAKESQTISDTGIEEIYHSPPFYNPFPQGI